MVLQIFQKQEGFFFGYKNEETMTQTKSSDIVVIGVVWASGPIINQIKKETYKIHQ